MGKWDHLKRIAESERRMGSPRMTVRLDDLETLIEIAEAGERAAESQADAMSEKDPAIEVEA